MTLRDQTWNPVYESGFNSNSLIDTFYRPFLSEVNRYDRLAGYLSLRSLADALEGVDSMLESGGTIRVIAGADLQERERGAMFPDANEPLAPWVESQLTIIATLLDRGDLHIKVGEPKSGDGLFHPKLGIGEDEDGNVLTFEGSVNETLSAWTYNYERFKVHRSWERGEEKYIKEDVSTFNALWNGYHPSVDVHELDEAAEQDLINWKDTDGALEDHVERVRKHAPQSALSEGDVATAVSVAGRTPGGLHLAEDVSTVTPWPHQRTISDTAVSIYPNNLLFCDEVGLGKTIEAGLTLSRLVHTGRVDNALFLVPAGLVQQWQDELLSRFNIHAYYYDRRYDGEYLVGPLGDENDNRVRIEGDSTTDEWSETPIGNFVTQREQPTVVIQSWHTARRDENHHHVAPSGEGDVWDLAVIDEAHSAREDTKLYDLLSKVEEATACIYALTATPMQLNIGELYDLLRLCDLPKSWDNKERFTEFFETRRALQTTLSEVSSNSSGSHDRQDVLLKLREELELEKGEVKPRLQLFAKLLHDHINAHPGYDDEVAEVIESNPLRLKERKAVEKLLGARETSNRFDDPETLVLDCGPAGWRALVDASEWATPVQSRIFRNTRTVLEQCKNLGLLTDTVPSRSVETKRIELGDAKPLYEKVEEYIDTTYEESQKVLTGKEKLALGFVMTTYRQRLTSSLHAIKKSLRRREDKLDAEVEDMTEEVSALGKDTGVTEATIDEVVGQETLDTYRPTKGHAASVVQAEREMLREFVDDLNRTHTDPKVAQLSQDIRSLRKEAIDDIIIFTQYQDTLEHIRTTLTDTHPNVGTYSGAGGFQYDPESGEWTSVGKETIKRSFTEEGGTNILICTDSASEGLNLQTADALINYDLPWNPMRVEQRIGRIDRIGQDNEVVKIINYAYKDSVDGDIYEELEERLELFENVVGPMRPVLNSIEQDFKDAMMGADDNDSRTATERVAEMADERAAEAKEREEETGLAKGAEEPATREEIIEDAGLVGWDGSKHPALTSVGVEERRYEPTVGLKTIEQLLLHSEKLEEVGWSFTALRNHDRAEEFAGTSTNAYVLETLDEDDVESPEQVTETAQSVLGRGRGVVVTFSPKVADQFPSIRLLLPGDPLFETLLSVVSDTNPRNVELVYGSRREVGPPRIVVGEEGSLDTADVVGVGAVDESVCDLPGDRSLESITATEETLREWLTVTSD